MAGLTSPQRSAKPSVPLRYGPAVGEPPPWVDPRRWGSLIGLVGGLVFIGSYSPVLGAAVSTVAWVAGVAVSEVFKVTGPRLFALMKENLANLGALE